MEAKDTVIKREDCEYQPDGDKDELWADLGAVYQGIYLEGCKAQAEISFRAGRESVLSSLPMEMEETWAKVGRKEVVGWASRYEKPYIEFGEECFPIRIEIPIANWRAKLKEWGIE